MYKRVGIQLAVPDGEYCKNLKGDKSECEHLNYEQNGTYTCDIFFIINLVEIKEYGVKKPEECSNSQPLKLEYEKDNDILRELLWLRHGCEITSLYGDDGQMQCGLCMIDFKVDSAESIKNRWESVYKKKLMETFKEKEDDN